MSRRPVWAAMGSNGAANKRESASYSYTTRGHARKPTRRKGRRSSDQSLALRSVRWIPTILGVRSFETRVSSPPKVEGFEVPESGSAFLFEHCGNGPYPRTPPSKCCSRPLMRSCFLPLRCYYTAFCFVSAYCYWLTAFTTLTADC